MDETLSVRKVWKEPWFLSMLCLVLVPVAPEYYGAPILSAIAFLFALKDTGRPFFRHHIPLTGQIILLYIAYMALGLLYSCDRGSTALTVGFWLTAFLGYLSFTLVVTSRERLELLLFLFSLAAGLIGAIAVVQHLVGLWTDLKINMQFYAGLDQFLGGITGWPFNLENHGNRASSTFANPNVLGEYMVMALPFMIWAAMRLTDPRRRKWVRISLVLAIFGLFFSFSRGGYIAAILVAVVFLFHYRKHYQMLLFLCVASLILVPSSVVRRLFSLSNASGVVSEMLEDDFSFEDGISDNLDTEILEDSSKDTYVERLDVLLIGLQLVGEKPLHGVGAGMFTTWETYLDHGVDVPHAHNLIIQLLLEGGIWSLLLMLAVGASLLAKGWQLYRKKTEEPLFGMTLIAFFVGFVAVGMFDFPLLSPKLVFSFMFILALCDTVYNFYVPHRHFSMLSYVKKRIFR